MQATYDESEESPTSVGGYVRLEISGQVCDDLGRIGPLFGQRTSDR